MEIEMPKLFENLSLNFGIGLMIGLELLEKIIPEVCHARVDI